MAIRRVRVRNGRHSVITTEQHLALLAYANQVLGVQFDPAQCAWISQLHDDGSIAAVVVYSRFSVHNVEMSIATDGRRSWATRAFLRACYRYVFVQMQKTRITVVIEEDNEKSLAMCRKLGHVEEGRLKCWFGSKDGIVMRMLKEECKWL